MIKKLHKFLSKRPHQPLSRPLVKKQVSAALFFSDMAALILSFFLAFYTAWGLADVIHPDAYYKPLSEYGQIGNLFFLWLYPIILFLFFSEGHYTRSIPWWSQVQSILSICIRFMIFDAFTRMALDMSFSRALLTLCWVYVFFLTLFGRQIIYILARKKDIWKIPVIVIGDIDTITNILYAFSTDHYTGYDIKKVFLRDKKNKKFNLDTLPRKYANIKIHREDIDYKTYIAKHIDNFFVISMEAFRGTERDTLVKSLNELEALYAIVPPTSNTNTFKTEPAHFFGCDIMLLHTKRPTPSPMGLFIKRLMDITLSSIAITLLSPIILACAIMLKIEGQSSSIFYDGIRIGKNGRKFRCWKIRSMEPGLNHLLDKLLEENPELKSDWEKYRKLKVPDPRVTTRTARFMRRTSIDELPQLWNILKGDMSIVGPRPILENEIELFGDTIEEYGRMRPGLTGLWQVSGRNDTSFERRIYWDSWYSRNWSMWNDIVIIIRTIKVVFSRGGAY